MDEKKNIGIFSAIGIEEVEWDAFISTWYMTNHSKLRTRKYTQDFNPLEDKVCEWVYAHKNEITLMTLEQQEERMIAEGVLKKEDI